MESIFAADIQSWVLGEAVSWLVQRIGEDFIPPMCDLSCGWDAYTIHNVTIFDAARALLSCKLILAFSSSLGNFNQRLSSGQIEPQTA